MAETKLSNRRSFLKIASVSIASGQAAAVEPIVPIAFSMVFESRSTNICISAFKWPKMSHELGLFAYLKPVFLNPQSQPYVFYLGEEIPQIPDWFDIGWDSPLLEHDPSDQSKTYKDLSVNAKTYKTRIQIKSAIPASTINQVRRAKNTMLYLRFIFSESTVKFDFYTQKWK